MKLKLTLYVLTAAQTGFGFVMPAFGGPKVFDLGEVDTYFVPGFEAPQDRGNQFFLQCHTTHGQALCALEDRFGYNISWQALVEASFSEETKLYLWDVVEAWTEANPDFYGSAKILEVRLS